MKRFLVVSAVLVVGGGLAAAAAVPSSDEPGSAHALLAALHDGEHAHDAAKADLATLSARMQELAKVLHGEMDVEKNLETAKEKWDLDDEKSNDLLTFLTHLRDIESAHGNHDASHQDLLKLLASAQNQLGDEQAAWLKEKHGRVAETSEEMQKLGSELAVAALARRDAAMAQNADAMKLAENARKVAEESYRDAMAQHQNHADHWKELVERSVDHEAINKMVKESLAAAEEARKAHFDAASKFRDEVANGKSAERYAEWADMAKKLAAEQKAAQGLYGDAMKELLTTQAARARDIAAAREKAAAERAHAMAERHKAHADVAKERAANMEKAERERTLTKRRGDQGDLDAARREIEELKKQIQELQRRVETLHQQRQTVNGRGASRNV